MASRGGQGGQGGAGGGGQGGGYSAPGPGPVVGARAKLDFFFFDRKSVHGGSRILIRGGAT